MVTADAVKRSAWASAVGRRWWAAPRPAWFDYVTILLLQLSRMWGIWSRRDMAGGDTCAYFVSAYRWFRHRHLNFAFSPTYTSFWGSLLYLTDDVAVGWLLHRMLIVLTATALVLAVFRKLLPRDLAWLAAAWWAVLPINFDTPYEVHLFALLPILLAWLAILTAATRGPSTAAGAWWRGTAVALMIGSTFLVRNEMIVSLACLGLVCLLLEVRAQRLSVRRPPLKLAAAYVFPALAALGMVLFYYGRSDLRGDALREQVRSKHIVSIGQAYALGYAERHPGWDKNPWTDFEDANRRDFGVSYPTLSEMLRRNPRAVITHSIWNLRLLPAAVQLLLFNRTSDRLDPDITPHRDRSGLALALSIFACIIVAATLWRRRRRGIGDPPRGDGWWTWLEMLAVVSFSVPVILLLRPRPAYLYSVSLLVMASIGTCLHLLAGQWSIWRRVAPLMGVFMVVLPMCVPSAYGTRKHHGPQPLLEDYERLRGYEKLLDRADAVFVGMRPVEIANYVGHGRCQVFDYSILNEMKPQTNLAQFLNARHVTLLELDQTALRKLESLSPGSVAQFFENGVSAGWRLLEIRQLDRGWWMLFAHSPERHAGADGPFDASALTLLRQIEPVPPGE